MSASTGTIIVPSKVIYSLRRTLCLQVNRSGELIVRAPKQASVQHIQSFINAKSDWITRAISKVNKVTSQVSVFDQLSLAEINQAKVMAKINFEQRLKYWSQIMNLKYEILRITTAKTLWGSCSGRGKISLNWKLQLMPFESLEYVIIHELAHLRHQNHSSKFWNLVEQYCPNYKLTRKQLKGVL